MVNEDVLKPIKLFAYIYFVGFGLFALAIPLTSNKADSEGVQNLFIFCYVFSFIHFFIGIGTLTRKKWGFYLFKYYLYLLRPGWPIMSIISKKMLDYIEDNKIEELFGRKTLSIK